MTIPPVTFHSKHLTDLSHYYSKSLLKSLSSHVAEHYPKSSLGVYPIENDSKIAILTVANKYSPNNFWYAGVRIMTKLCCPLFAVADLNLQEWPLAFSLHLLPR